jgi:hypothetical protein
VLIVSIVVWSAFKHDVVWMTIDFLDLMLIDYGTVMFVLTIYPELRPLSAILLLVAITVVVLLWRYDSALIPRSSAALGCVACLAGLVVLALAAPGDWWEIFAKQNFVSKFSRSAVLQVEELLTHGYLEADASTPDKLPASQGSCVPPAKLPHVILVHDESAFDIRVAPGIKVPEGYGPHFLSFDGKTRQFRAESYGGASWYA